MTDALNCLNALRQQGYGMATRAKAGKTGDSVRQDAAAWTKAALAVLAEQGVSGVRVEVLAREMGVTKGSFYWHFKDRDALLEAMLSHWRHQATLGVMERLDRTQEHASKRLRKLLQLPIVGRASERGADVELAIRLWGRQDPRAKRALAEVDELRLRYIGNLLVETGLSESAARARAILAYSYMRVAASLVGRDETNLMERCESILIGS